MKKIIIATFLTLFLSFISVEKANAAEEVCEKSHVYQDVLGGDAYEGRVYMYLFDRPDGSHIIKTGFFYNQRVRETGQIAFCVDMGNSHATSYLASDKAYQEWINKVDPKQSKIANKDFYALRILTIQDAVNEEWAKVFEDRTRIDMYGSLDKTKIDTIAYIMAQVASWALSEGVPSALDLDIVNMKTDYLDGRKVVVDPMRIVLAQAMCAIYDHSGELKKGEISVCAYDPELSLQQQGSEFRRAYAELADYHNGKYNQHEYGFVKHVWDSFDDSNGPGGYGGLFENEPNDVFSQAISDYRNGVLKPTLLLPSDVTRYQRLLSYYTCNKKGDDPKGCWTLDVSIPNTCKTSNNSGWVSDTNDWDCIFKATKSGALGKHYDIDDSNSYCHVYCREEISIKMPNSGTITSQGSYLTVNLQNGKVNDISPIIYGGTKICRPTSPGRKGKIDYKQFETDYKAADAVMTASWANYQQKVANVKTYNTATAGAWRNSTVCKTWIKDPDKVEKAKKFTIPADEYEDYVPGYEDLTDEEKATAIEIATEEKIEELIDAIPEDVCSVYWKIRTWSVTATKSGIYSPSVGSWNQMEYGSNDKTSKIASAEIEQAKAKADYDRDKAYRDDLIGKIESCVGTKMDVDYGTFKPNLQIGYEEKVYGNFPGWTLNRKLVNDPPVSKETYTASGTSSLDEDTPLTTGILNPTINPSSCTIWGCKAGSRTYKTAEWWESSKIKIYHFTLPKSVYRYVEKGTGQSFHQDAIDDDEEHYLDMGVGNLPIHYSAVPNKKYIFKIKTKAFGGKDAEENKFDPFIFKGQEFSGRIYYNIYKDYKCDYEVNCNPMIADNPACPDTPTTGDGLNLVYRTISLNSAQEAFPGITGNGREPGSNWSEGNNISEYIVNNRDSKGYNIYIERDPLYEIELTPKLMRKLREYNKNVNKTIRTIYDGTSAKKMGIVGYTGYEDFDCKSDGTECKSNLIRGKVEGYKDIVITGCGINDKSGSCLPNEAW